MADPGMNLGFHGERLVANCLSHGMAKLMGYSVIMNIRGDGLYSVCIMKIRADGLMMMIMLMG
jgi:hypothetical protein